MTVRVVGGGFDQGDAAAAQVWLIESGTGNVVAESGPGGNPRVVEFDPANASRYRALEVDIDIPKTAPLGVYDIEVKVGDVAVAAHKAGSTMGEKWHGEHGGLVIGRVVNFVRLRITRDEAGGAADYVPITDANRDVLPGQLMKLKLEAETGGLPIARRRWIVPGVTFEDYSADGNRAELDKLYEDDLDGETVDFYWADSGEAREVKCAVTTGGVEVVASAKLNVRTLRIHPTQHRQVSHGRSSGGAYRSCRRPRGAT